MVVYVSNTFNVLFFQVVEQGMFVKHCKVEVYLTELKLCEDSNMDNVITRRFSKADTIGGSESLATLDTVNILSNKSWSCSDTNYTKDNNYM